MNGTLLSTSIVPQREAFAYWQDLICDVFIHLDCTSPSRRSFSGSIYNQPLGPLQISSMMAAEMRVVRSPRQIARVSEDYFIVPIQGRRRTVGTQDGRDVVLESSDFTVFDGTRPYQATMSAGFEHCVLKIPRGALRQRLAGVDGMAALRVRGDRGLGCIASAFVRSLPAELDQLDSRAVERLSDTTLDLIAAALGSVAGPSAVAESSTRVAHRVRARAFIAANVTRSDLTPGDVAKALGVSSRYLAALFADEGTSVGRVITGLRLERCRAALTDPLQAGRTIAEVAYGWGWNDLSHFSRSFRTRYGASPREYRAQSRSLHK